MRRPLNNNYCVKRLKSILKVIFVNYRGILIKVTILQVLTIL